MSALYVLNGVNSNECQIPRKFIFQTESRNMSAQEFNTRGEKKKDQFIKIHKNVVLTTVLDEQNKTKNKTNSQTRSVL